ncbi:MAG: hypothetical protein J4O04_05635 [Chloroflexi bacterium]|nr:hypothetical protein [Chloroflexota bacterium]
MAGAGRALRAFAALTVVVAVEVGRPAGRLGEVLRPSPGSVSGQLATAVYPVQSPGEAEGASTQALQRPAAVWRAILEFALPGRDANVLSLMANVDRSRADAWRDDPRVAAIASDPLLGR